MKLLINPGNFALLLVEYSLQLLFELPLIFFEVLGDLYPEFFFLFLELFDLLIKHLNMKLQLLLDLDVISHLGLILLQLLLILFGRQVDGLERGGEAGVVQVSARANAAIAVRVEVAMGELV